MVLYQKLIFFLLATSSIVFLEPAPYDYLIILCLVLAMFLRLISFPSLLILPSMLLLVFLNSSLFLLTLSNIHLQVALKYHLITLYLVISWVLFVGILQKNYHRLLPIILSGYLVAALLVASLGILAYFELLPYFSQVLLQFGRVAGTFKDPNVFGPFLILPILYCLNNFELKPGFRAKIFWIFAFSFLSVGVLLSFSRAAWGNYGITLGIYLLLLGRIKSGKRLITLLVLSAVFISGTIFLMYETATIDFLFSRLTLQVYDVDRFGTQTLALKHLLTQPYGIGPGQSELTFSYSIHSLYIRVFVEGGLISGFAFILFVVITTGKAIYNCYLGSKAMQPYFIVFTAALIGVLFNSFFIDTLHWRHFWLLLSLPWLPLQRQTQIEKEEDPGF